MACPPWDMAEADRRDYDQPLGEAHHGLAYKIDASSLLRLSVVERTSETQGENTVVLADQAVANLRRGIGFVAGAYRLEVRCPPSTARTVPVI
jgi:hypothetical protein